MDTQNRRRLRWLVVPVVLACLLLPSPPDAAADDPAAELAKYTAQMQEVQAKISESKDALNRTYWEREQVKVRLQQTEGELFLAQSKHALLDEQRKAVQETWKQLDGQVKETEQRLQTRKGQFYSRLRAIQERGRVSYLGVLFGSNSYGDFLSRMEMLKIIVEHDVELMGVIRTDKEKLEVQREAAATEEKRLKDLQAQVDEQKRAATAKQSELKVQNSALVDREHALELEVAKWEREWERLGQEIYELQRQMNRQAGRFAPVEPIRGRPTITEVFGWVPDPIVGGMRNHGGTDYGAARGTPVLAIEDGVVIARRYDSVYGNLIVIDHGGGIASWYAHLDAFSVAENATVTQGQQIGKVGSTGYSTGPHLHLEIRVNNVKKDPMSYLKR
ncbi:MAG TPA: peptidoglycan DD-metalloendopeptidase family protein [Symbiobacteriaceae bacterium]|nr:peptidoglycan DD-metalloendopeptidase family protein [Symbiobacteriaceae bacterium]